MIMFLVYHCCFAYTLRAYAPKTSPLCALSHLADKEFYSILFLAPAFGGFLVAPLAGLDPQLPHYGLITPWQIRASLAESICSILFVFLCKHILVPLNMIVGRQKNIPEAKIKATQRRGRRHSHKAPWPRNRSPEHSPHQALVPGAPLHPGPPSFSSLCRVGRKSKSR